MESKKWWKSKTILAGIVTILIVVYGAVSQALADQCGIEGSFCLNLPAIPDWVFGILATFGIYGRTKATTVIK